MRILLLASLFLFDIPEIRGQDEYFVLKGELKNSRTKEEVPWASLFIKGTSLGVPSNQRGVFEFSIDTQYAGDSLVISALGYQRISFLIQDLKKNEYSILKLNEKTYQLNEVTVESPDPSGIVRLAMDKWVTNFQTSEYEFESFYRTTQKENGKYARLWECAMRGFDKGGDSDKQGPVDIEYLQIRKSDDYRDSRTRWLFAFFKPQFIFGGENHTRNYRAFVKKLEDSSYEYELDSILYLDNTAVYIINAMVKESVKEFLFDVKFYIRADDNTFVQMDFDGKRKIRYVKPSGIPGKLKLGMTEYKSTYVFKEIDHRMYMYYLNVYAAFNWSDESGGVIYDEENSEAIVQNIQTISKTEKSTVNRNFPKHAYGAPHSSYNGVFWKKYEMVRQIPYGKGVIDDLQRETPLEQQFIKNGPVTVKNK
jgi:CarboxypepD_reg-like domain